MESLLRPRPSDGVWERLPERGMIDRTLAGLNSRGFKAELVLDRRGALERVSSLIPEGARVMTGGSRSLEEIGFTQILATGSHPWINLKGQILAEKDMEKQLALRRQAVFADYFLGSVHAITTAGQIIAGSATGSQLAAYAYGGKNLILVAGTNKITVSLDEGLRRLREHSVPLEDKRMKGLGLPGTTLSKILVYEREPNRNVHVILVNEKLGF